MSQLSVETTALVDAAGVLSKSLSALVDARTGILSAATAAESTPADAACHAASEAAARSTAAMRTACEDLSKAIGKAAANYINADKASTTGSSGSSSSTSPPNAVTSQYGMRGH